jgi:hypothetical protein
MVKQVDATPFHSNSKTNVNPDIQSIPFFHLIPKSPAHIFIINAFYLILE